MVPQVAVDDIVFGWDDSARKKKTQLFFLLPRYYLLTSVYASISLIIDGVMRSMRVSHVALMAAAVLIHRSSGNIVHSSDAVDLDSLTLHVGTAIGGSHLGSHELGDATSMEQEDSGEASLRAEVEGPPTQTWRMT